MPTIECSDLRIASLGNSGSGKSTLASALSRAANLPILDLDTVAWEPEQVAVPRSTDLACQDVQAFCQRNKGWVVEGCYTALIQAALEHGAKLILLNPGPEACLSNCQSRPWETHKYASKEEQDANLPFLLSWVSGYYSRRDAMSWEAHLKCFNAFGGSKLEIRSLPDVGKLVSELIACERSTCR